MNELKRLCDIENCGKLATNGIELNDADGDCPPMRALCDHHLVQFAKDWGMGYKIIPVENV